MLQIVPGAVVPQEYAMKNVYMGMAKISNYVLLWAKMVIAQYVPKDVLGNNTLTAISSMKREMKKKSMMLKI